jgi:transcriptional regulator with XRE-family HTH domain
MQITTVQTNAEIATTIQEIRTGKGLSQRALAELVGTTASVICRLENASYDGHSLAMLKRVAAALHHQVELRFLPADGGIAVSGGRTRRT